MSATGIVEGALSGRALVFGSLPPEGRDLDLLVSDPERRAAADALDAAGFRNRGQVWVRVRGCTIEAVDLVSAGSWDLPRAELEELFAEATPLADHEHLVAPAPHHVLLILARRIAAGDELTPKRRARLRDALAAGEPVWDHAAARATAWNANSGLKRLRELHRDTRHAARRRWPRRPSRRPRVLIALQGMDGSGKSSLGDKIAEMVRTLGHEPAIVWNRLAVNPSLDIVAVPIKRLLGLFRIGRASTDQGGDRDGSGGALRARSPLLTQVWTCFVALWNAASHRRSVQGHLMRGRIVICDRYVLDSAVNLRFRYGMHSRFRLQKRLIELISPRPTLSFHLAVPAAIAHERKPVKFTPEELAAFERLYEEERPERIVRLDGTRPPEELCEAVGWALWDALG